MSKVEGQKSKVKGQVSEDAKLETGNSKLVTGHCIWPSLVTRRLATRHGSLATVLSRHLPLGTVLWAGALHAEAVRRKLSVGREVETEIPVKTAMEVFEMANRRRGARIAILSLAILAGTTRCWAGPFGFERGMTKEQIMKLLGAGSLIKADGNVYTFSKVPKPHPLFEEYVLIISPTEGLLKVAAISKDIETSVYGEELKASFEEIRGALTKTYGEGKTYDFLKYDSIWNEPKDWMMGMLK